MTRGNELPPGGKYHYAPSLHSSLDFNCIRAAQRPPSIVVHRPAAVARRDIPPGLCHQKQQPSRTAVHRCLGSGPPPKQAYSCTELSILVIRRGVLRHVVWIQLRSAAAVVFCGGLRTRWHPGLVILCVANRPESLFESVDYDDCGDDNGQSSDLRAALWPLK